MEVHAWEGKGRSGRSPADEGEGEGLIKLMDVGENRSSSLSEVTIYLWHQFFNPIFNSCDLSV